MELDTLLQLMANLGIPTAFAIYLMIWKRKDDEKTNEILQNFALNIQENTILLKQLNETISRMKGDQKNE